MSIYIVYEINLWPFIRDDSFTLANPLFGAVKLTENSGKKYKYSGYRIGSTITEHFHYLMAVDLTKIE